MPGPISLVSLVRALWRAGHNAQGERRAPGGLRHALHGYLAWRGLAYVPFGDSDSKTASPGTYRPVGLSCPVSCPYLGAGCYAEHGKVGMAQRRADTDRDAALTSAAAVMVWAALSGRVARLHVSGDLGSGDGPDMAYVAGLCTIAREVRRLRGGDEAVAWTYTHHKPGPFIEQLHQAGVFVRVSDLADEGGAVVVTDRERARALRSTGVRVAVCPSQLSEGTTCDQCRLCWRRPDLTIAFIVHGAAHRQAAASTPNR